MEFRDNAAIASFRDEVRDWINNDLSAEEREFDDFGMSPDDSYQRVLAVRKKLSAKGWAAPAWPKEYGGMGASVRQQAVFNEELSYNRVPGPDFIGINYVGPTLMLYGTPEQKSRFLPKILSGDEKWCQGYSEPGSGSDLASLQTRAVLDGDEFVVNGQKIWTSGAHRADWIFLLVRTDPDAPKHRGISYLLADMKSPGIQVRPLVNMAGSHEFNEVFFEDLRIPRDQLVGEMNRGWYVGMATMDFERSAIGGVAGNRRDLEDIVDEVKARGQAVTPAARMEVADRRVEVDVTRMLSQRIISIQESGNVPNYEASIAKLFTSELNQRMARTAMHVLGLDGQAPRNSVQTRWMQTYSRSVSATIAGGTSEIQRNIVATRGLGLPRG
ncbi:MAG: acyl-CoA dehydrogenase family protein [Dehalococcoidia bacterium]|nr:acyl-CoA dehydrogenase family protein [Dehalococcoidia bacterium]MCB9485284.1 acyl-CoA dehydrogenase family protein [Thermoflexaceae bacterium]